MANFTIMRSLIEFGIGVKDALMDSGIYGIIKQVIRKEGKLNYKKKRLKMGFTQEEVASKLGISLYAWQLVERGSTKTPRKETQKKINKLFGKEVK